MPRPRNSFTIWLGSLLFNVSSFGWNMLICAVFLPVVLLTREDSAVHPLARLWVRVTFALLKIFCGLDHEIRGLENLLRQPCIIAPKHQSAWDTMIFALLIDEPCYVIKRELTSIPMFSTALRRAGMIPVDRAGGSKALRSMIAMARQRRAADRTILIFPEGTRTAPGERRPYHPGVAALYRELGVPVVPVALNSGLYWPRRGFEKRPGRIILEFLPPIDPGLPRHDFMRRLEDAIEDGSTRLLNRFDTPAPPANTVDKPVDKI